MTEAHLPYVTYPVHAREFTDDFPTPTIGKDMARLCISIRDIKEDGSNFQQALPENFVGKYFHDGKYPDTGVMVVTSTQYGEENYVAIVFRGYDSSKGWLINFKYDLMYPSMIQTAPRTTKVHSGYYESVFSEDLALTLCAQLEEIMNTTGIQNIHISGHSQGGAAAHILGVHLAEKYDHRSFTVINFGSPPVGNETFKHWTEKLPNLAVWRVVNKHDIIPRQCLKFFHAGHLIQIGRLSSKAYYRHDGQDDFAGVSERWYRAVSISNHFMKSYAKFFEKKAHIPRYWPTKFKQVKWFKV